MDRQHWVRLDALSAGTVAQAIALMGVVMGLRFLEGLFRGSILGLQRQVLYNVIHAVMATLRGVSAVAVLAIWSPSPSASLRHGIWMMSFMSPPGPGTGRRGALGS